MTCLRARTVVGTLGRLHGQISKGDSALRPLFRQVGTMADRVREFSQNGENGELLAIVESGPRKYDPQKATRITLYQTLLIFTFGAYMAGSGWAVPTRASAHALKNCGLHWGNPSIWMAKRLIGISSFGPCYSSTMGRRPLSSDDLETIRGLEPTDKIHFLADIAARR